MTTFEMYKTLGLNYGASAEEIKEAYRRLVKKYHPDITKNNGSGLQLNNVIQAYKTLIVTKRTRNLVDFPVKNVKKKTPEREFTRNTDIFSLGNLLENGKTVGMRAFAARSLGNTGRRTAYAFLRKALTDPSDLVVKTAVEAIGDLKIRQSYGELFAVFSKGSREIRESVLCAVDKIGINGAFSDIVEAAVMDSDINIRNMARKMLRESEKAAQDG